MRISFVLFLSVCVVGVAVSSAHAQPEAQPTSLPTSQPASIPASLPTSQPASIQPASIPSGRARAEHWYYKVRGKRRGPVTAAVLRKMIRTCQLGREDRVWREGFDRWNYLGAVTRFSRDVLLAQCAQTQATPTEGQEVSFDKYSNVAEQKLLLTGKIESSIPEEHFQTLYNDLGFNRFNTSIRVSDPNHPEVQQWCEKAVRDTQVRRREVDGETGDAMVTLKAKMERCSQVFSHDIKVTHACERKVPKKGDPYMSCTVVVTATIYKFSADQSSGELRYSPDQSFATGGKIVMQADNTGTSTITKDRPPAEATRAAIGSAVRWAGLKLKRSLREIKEFQSSAPIVAARSGTAFVCLGQDTVELDMPFYVVRNSPQGEVREGFVKARRMYDGCTLTPSQAEAKANGKSFTNQPMEAQIILGSSSIKPGMTLQEMPSIGLNIGVFGGISGSLGFFNGNFGPGGGMTVEFDLAPYIGLSEFYAFTDFSIIGVLDPEQVRQSFVKMMGHDWDTVVTPDLDAVFAIQASLGGLKRFYIAGPLFAEAALAFAFSFYSIGKFEHGGDEISLGVYGLGAMVLGGVGFQLAPRWLLRFSGGYRYLISIPTVSVNDGSCEDAGYSNCDPEKLGVGPDVAEHGPVGRLSLLFTW